MATTADYKLPVVDVDTQRRNFPGYGKQVATFAELEEAMEGGTTDTSPGAERRNEPVEL